jgi:DNA repair photolyase
MNTENKVNLKAIKPSRTGFGHCINCYNGCEHGCRYCYGMETTHKTYDEWIKPVPRLQLIDWLRKDIEVLKHHPEIKADIEDIMVSSITDCYQPLEAQHRITREVIKLLIENELPFTILTKNASVLSDIDLFTGYDKCKVGLTIMTLFDNIRQSIEPKASPIQDRIEALKELHQAGVYTYCSVEPILPGSNPIEVIERVKGFVDLFEFGKLNPNDNYKVSPNKEYYIDVFTKINEYCDQNKINYCHAGHSAGFLTKQGLRFIPNPLGASVKCQEKPNSQVLMSENRL